MNGPLALKQQRDQLAFIMKEKRANDKAKNEEIRKAQLHQLKMRDAGGGAAVMVPMATPMMNNPEAGASDTVPAMLTPGEAVIPAPAAQHPRNKPVIEALVNEGRMANQGYSSGALKVPPMSGYADGSNYVGEKPAVQGYDGGVFQNWLNATMAQESTYGNDPNTWKNDGHVGLYQLSKGNFESLKKRPIDKGGIPKDYDYLNPAHNTEASMKLADEVWKTAGGDPEKASAIWYSGPKAIDKKTGEIKAFKDPKNPKAPDTIGYVSSVKNTMSRATPAEPVSPLSAGAIVPESKLTPQQIEGLVQPSTFPINPYSDDSNSQIPQPLNVATDSPVINSANIVGPNGTGSMRFDNAANDPRRTDVLPPVANGVPPDFRLKTLDEIAPVTQQSGDRTGKDLRAEAYKNFNTVPPTVDSRPIINEAVPVPSGILESELGNELGDVLPGETRQRQLSTNESIAAINDRISKLDSNNPLDLRTIQELEAEKLNLYNEAGARGEVSDSNIPPLPIEKEPYDENFPGYGISETDLEKMPDLDKEKYDTDFNRRLETFNNTVYGEMDADNLDAVTKSLENAEPNKNPPESFWNWLKGTKFSEMFDSKEFYKFGILLAGGLLTGGSFAGSLRYAGLYALQSADKREATKAQADKELDKERIKAGATAKTARIKALSDEVQAGIKSGRFPLQTGDKILKVLNGPDGVLKAEALLSQEGIESPVYRAGLDSSKPLQVMVEGKLAPVTAYENPNTGAYSYVDSEVDENGIRKSFLINLPKNKATVTDKNFDQNQTAAFNELSDKLLSTGVIVRNKDNKPINIDQAVNKDMLIGQLREWSGKQRELGLNDDPRVYIDTINIALRKAVESGDKNPHMGKLLDLAILNSASIIDEDKLTGANSGYIGNAVEDIKSFSSKFKDKEEKEKFMKSLTGSKSSKNKKVASELQRRSSKFFDDVSKAYGDGKDALDQDDLAEKLKENAGKNMNRTLYDKVKEAPNKWWAYVYYQIGLEEAKQKKAK